MLGNHNGHTLFLNHFRCKQVSVHFQAGMREAGRAIEEHHGVKEVEIRGGERSSGANKAKTPRAVVIKVDK